MSSPVIEYSQWLTEVISYGRILKRINEQLTERERKQVRKVLGWVGCSKLPMRKREIEAALAIRQEDRRFFKGHRVFLNIPRLCGPVLEIENDVVQFVHFTAKQSAAWAQPHLKGES
jgi:hypothetical protein